LADGALTLLARQTYVACTVRVASSALSVTIDATLAAPRTPNLALSPYTTLFRSTTSDNITNDATPTVSGNGAEAGATVSLYDSNSTSALVSATAEGRGNRRTTS